MPICPFFNNCKWIEKYSSTNGARINLYIKNYCKGDSLRRCVRKKVSEKLGGREFIPDNMQPDGKPVKGTNDSEWSEEVKEIIRSIREIQHMKN
ncbi:MAG: hypothetical protein JW931_03350 [Methanomicrobiaceae archaeon]|nr:hypothetical protein [Methanomicrobiaceae archaeon]